MCVWDRPHFKHTRLYPGLLHLCGLDPDGSNYTHTPGSTQDSFMYVDWTQMTPPQESNSKQSSASLGGSISCCS